LCREREGETRREGHEGEREKEKGGWCAMALVLLVGLNYSWGLK
jgi:hypothetical protein